MKYNEAVKFLKPVATNKNFQSFLSCVILNTDKSTFEASAKEAPKGFYMDKVGHSFNKGFISLKDISSDSWEIYRVYNYGTKTFNNETCLKFRKVLTSELMDSFLEWLYP